MLSNEYECHKCNNFGHTAGECRSWFTSILVEDVQIPEYQRTWKRKEGGLQGEVCEISLQAQDKRNSWYINSGFSKHMTCDKNRLVNLKKENDGSVTFGNNNSAKILGRGTVSLGSKDAMAENVLLVEDMKHNLLSVIQMCDQGHNLLFIAKKCEIRREK